MQRKFYTKSKLLQQLMQRNFIQKQTPTTVKAKKFYTKSKIVKQENFSIFCNYCLKIV